MQSEEGENEGKKEREKAKQQMKDEREQQKKEAKKEKEGKKKKEKASEKDDFGAVHGLSNGGYGRYWKAGLFEIVDRMKIRIMKQRRRFRT